MLPLLILFFFLVYKNTKLIRADCFFMARLPWTKNQLWVNSIRHSGARGLLGPHIGFIDTDCWHLESVLRLKSHPHEHRPNRSDASAAFRHFTFWSPIFLQWSVVCRPGISLVYLVKSSGPAYHYHTVARGTRLTASGSRGGALSQQGGGRRFFCATTVATSSCAAGAWWPCS